MGFHDLKEIDRMTPYEYSLRMKAYKRQRLEESRHIHEQAFAIAAAQSTKKSGKNVVAKYQSFEKFFDYKKELDELYEDKKKPQGIAARVIDYRRKHSNE